MSGLESFASRIPLNEVGLLAILMLELALMGAIAWVHIKKGE